MTQLALFNESKCEEWKNVRDRGGLFFVSHSGGKDSQAMYLYLLYDLKIPEDQIVVVHAHLGEIEWEGIADHIKDNIEHDLHIVQAVDKAGTLKTFISMVEARGMWPAPAYRQCTSDLKRGPIYKFIRSVMKDRGVKLAVNCTGMRAEESASRKRKKTWCGNNLLSKSGREIYEWLPIHGWSQAKVFDRIYEGNQKPFHAYGMRGELNDRLSCTFCIMGSVNDHRHAASHRPDLYRKLVKMESDMKHTMFQGKTLEERNNLTVEQAYKVIPTINVA